MTLRVAVTAQTKVGSALFVGGYVAGAFYHQGAIIGLCIKVFCFIDDLTVLVFLDLPFEGGLASSLVDFGHLFPNLYGLHTILVVPKYGGQLAYCHYGFSLQ